MENTAYRTNVRADPDGLARCPPLLTHRYRDLLQARELDWRSRQPPPWWVRHLERHVVTEAPATVFREANLQPDVRPFIASVIWTIVLVGIWASAQSAPPTLESAQQGLLRCLLMASLPALATYLVSRDGYGGELRSSAHDRLTVGVWILKYVLLPPVSLWLTFKEFVAWLMWMAQGKRWTYRPWDAERAMAEELRTFQETCLRPRQRALDAVVERFRTLRGQVREARERARHQRTQAGQARGGIQAILAQQLDAAATFEDAKAEAFDQEAARLETRIDRMQDALRTANLAYTTYAQLLEDRLKLEKTGSLPPHDQTDVQQQAILRTAYLALLDTFEEAEAISEPRAEHVIQDDEPAPLAARAGAPSPSS